MITPRWITLRLLPILVFPGLAAAQAPQWRALPNAPLSAGDRHEDVFFLNASTGWLVNLSGEIHKTTDGGGTWRLQHKDAETSFRSVGFADSLRGWAGTVFSNEPLFETFDGGETWSKVNLPDSVGGICGISVIGDSVVYGVGTFYYSSPLIKSTNRGATWQVIGMRAHATTLIEARFFSRDSGFVTGGFDSTGIGIFAGLKAVILFTGDGGLTWQKRHQSDTLESWIWKLSFPSRAVGYASMERFTRPRATVLKTTDSGRTWTERSFPGQSDVQGIGFTTGGLGWIGTHDSSYATSDGGQTWAPFAFGAGKNAVNRIRMLNDTLGYAAGKTVFKYSRSAAAGGLAREPGRPIQSGLFPENHPNPFRGETLIAFTLAKPAFVTLAVYDMRGRRVRLVTEGPRAAGRHAVRFEGRDLPPGPYIYRLRAGAESAAGEMLRLP
jgi:photosystem II stability/assembly factor-like uncharacterized protein